MNHYDIFEILRKRFPDIHQRELLDTSVEITKFFDNVSTGLDRFKEPLAILKAAGFKPIAVSTMICEDTFVFETEDEAQRAHRMFEVEKGTIAGWWYSKEKFFTPTMDYYKAQNGYYPEVIMIQDRD